MIEIIKVRFSRVAERQLNRIPRHIAQKLRSWVLSVQNEGIDATRKLGGYHDEVLKGSRKWQRSIRLSRSYRAIYSVIDMENKRFVTIEEINKHDY